MFRKKMFLSMSLICVVLALSSFVPAFGQDINVLFLTGLDDNGGYGSGDSSLVDLMITTFDELQKESIQIVSVTDSIVNDAVALNAYDLIFASAYVGSGDIKGKDGLINTTTPFINAETFAYQDHGWTTGGASSPNSTNATLTVVGDHDGIMGLWAVGDDIISHSDLNAEAHAVESDKLAPGAIALATMVDIDAEPDVVKTAVFVIPEGDSLANGTVAAGKRVGTYLRNEVPNSLVGGGELVFARLVAWCLDIEMPGDGIEEKSVLFLTNVDDVDGSIGSGDSSLVDLMISTFDEIKAENFQIVSVKDSIVEDAAALNTYDLIFVSAYVGSGDVKGKAGLKATTTPFINAESFAWQDHGWVTGGVSSPNSTNGILTVVGDHDGIMRLWAIDDEIISHSDLNAEAHAVESDKLAPGAIALTTIIDTDAEPDVVKTAAFVIPEGGELADASLAPGKRIGVYLRNEVPNSLVGGGELFFTRLVAWGLDIEMPGDGAPQWEIATVAENGSIAFSPAGPYATGQVVNVTAVPDDGFKFLAWTGDLTGSANPAEITIVSDMNVTAVFVDENTDDVPWVEPFDLPYGATSNVAPTSWTATRTEGFFMVDSLGRLMVNDAGTEGVLTSGIINIPPGSAVNISMDLDWSDGLDVGQDYIRLYAIVDGGDTLMVGEVDGTPADSTLSARYIAGSTLQMVIKSYLSHESEFYFIDNLSVTEIEGEVPTFGVISWVQNGMIMADPEPGPYAPWTQVTLTAVPTDGYEFVEWFGDLSGSTNPITVYMNGNVSISASFVPSTNLLSNSDFSQGASSWTPQVIGPAAAQFSYDNEELKVDISAISDEEWHVNLLQSGVVMVPGKTYTLRFDARAEVARTVTAKAQMDKDPWTSSLEEPVEITTEMKTYAFTWVQSDDESTYKVGVFFGSDTSTVWIDNIKLNVHEVTAIDNDADVAIPRETQLMQNYPNPFNPVTTIPYQLAKSSHVKIVIFNAFGQQVKTLVDKKQTAGFYSAKWNARNSNGSKVASGIYMYRLEVKDFVQMKKFILLQ